MAATKLSIFDVAGPELSIFDTHHITLIDFPDISLVRAEDETFALALIENAENRYEPKGLVDDVAVQHHSGRMNTRESMFFSVNPADFGNARLWSTPGSMSDDKRLLHDMRLAIGCNGQTNLRVVTYTRPSTQSGHRGSDGIWSEDFLGEVSMIRVARNTIVTWGPVVAEVTYDQYDIPLRKFDAIDCDEQWLEDIRNLITQRSDRAVRYVASRLEAQGCEIPDTSWKPARTANFATEIDKVTKMADLLALDDDERHCISCTEDLVPSDALALRCNDRHVVCRHCLLQWCHAQGAATASCPHCRQKVFTDLPTIERLKFGTVGKLYASDDRFNEFENSERSYADLDQSLAENNTAELVVCWKLLVKIWKSIAIAAGLEPAEATPLHLQPSRMPECEIVAAVFQAAVRSVTTAKIPVNELYKLVLEGIYRALARVLLRSPLNRTLSESTVIALTQHSQNVPLILRKLLRPGFIEFFERTLSRTLQFAHLRVCRCEGTTRVFHQHGLRSYYNPDSVPD